MADAAAARAEIRAHLAAKHAVEEFDPAATEASLRDFHVWDHETGEMGPEHDVEDLSEQ